MGFKCLAHRAEGPVVLAGLDQAGEALAAPVDSEDKAEGPVAPADSAPVLLFSGCGVSRDLEASSVVRKLALLMSRARVDFAVLADAEDCCGMPAYWTGHRDVFTKIAADRAQRFDDLGAETIVTASGSCLGAMRSKYPEYARRPRAQVVHATEFLARLIEERYPIYTQADITVDSRDTPHEVMVQEITSRLVAHLAAVPSQ